MPRRRSTQRLSQDRRIADIMAAARIIIRAKGYEAASMADIAEQAGVVEGTLYRFFESKRALLLKVADEWFSTQLGEDADLAAIEGIFERLRYIIWRTLRVTHAEPALSRFILTELRPTTEYRSSHFFEVNRRYTLEVRELCRLAVENGEFRADVSASIVRDLIFGGIEHQTWSYLRGEGDFDLVQVADGIANVVYGGMRVTPGRDDRLGSAIDRLEAVAARIETAGSL